MTVKRPDYQTETTISMVMLFIILILISVIFGRASSKRGANERTYQNVHQVNH